MGAFKNIDQNVSEFMKIVDAYAAAVALKREFELKNDLAGLDAIQSILLNNYETIRTISEKLFTKNEGLKNARL